MTQKNRTQRKLPGGSPPVVTYSRHRDEDLPDVYDEARVEPPFEEEAVAEWEAVEVPPEPPLHARRRSRPLVEEVRVPVDPDRFPDEPADDERPARRARAKRSTGMRLVTVAAVAAILLGVGILAYAFMSSSTAPVTAPSLSEGGAPPGTVPADEAGDAAATVREIPLNSDGTPVAAPPPQSASTDPAEPEVFTPPVAPPVPRARPEPPPATATVAPDFDQAAPLPQPAMPTLPQAATPPPPATGNDDFISNIERTLQQSRGTNEPTLSPSTEQPIQLAPPPQQLAPPQPQLLAPGELLPPPPEPTFGPQPQTFPAPVQTFPAPPQQGLFVPPADIPMLDGQNQPILLPGDYLIDTQ